jgi:hypothetical protein
MHSRSASEVQAWRYVSRSCDLVPETMFGGEYKVAHEYRAWLKGRSGWKVMTTHEQNFSLIRERAGIAKLKATPIPKLPDDYILVRTKAIALNPTDWSTLDAPGNSGTVVGCDYSGIVVEVGPAVRRAFKKGDRVAGFGHGGTFVQ